MTFEEAIEIIEKVDGEFGAFRYIINKLQETYAPKIKMTKKEAEMLKRLKRLLRIDVGIVDYNGQEPKVLLSNEFKFVDAWLHPEFIEVSDDSSRID